MAKQPNILFVMTDQQRFDTIAALGNPIIKTPVLDRLAREGTAFNRCYTPSPVCVSARCALLTGLPPHITGCVDNMPQPQDTPSFMECLRASGYETHGTGKMHFEPDPLRPWGFDGRDVSEEGECPGDDYREFLKKHGVAHVDDPHGVRSEYYYLPQPSQLPAHLHHTAWVADRSLDFLKRRDQARPFFLWTSFIKPHPPFESPTPWNKLYRAAEMPAPFRPDNYGNLLNYWNRAQNRYKYRDAGFDDLMLRTMHAAYLASISFIDHHLGRILGALGDELDRTLVLFTSDHGELLGDYGSFGKRCMLDAAARVPMIARWPGHFKSGRVCETPTTLLDVWPTFLAAAGETESHAHSEGDDLSVIASGQSPRRFVFSQFQRGRYGLYMVTDGQSKYIYSAPDHREWLFDLHADPRETLNLAENPIFVGLCREMQRHLMTRFQRDGYLDPLEGEGWKHYPPPEFPLDPDGGLLFQDPPSLEQRMEALGAYARKTPVGSANCFLAARSLEP